MKFSKILCSLIASAAVCAAPAFAQGHGGGGSVGQHIGHVFITPVACDGEAEIYEEGAFAQWVRVNRTHFTGLEVGMTDPDDDFDETVGARLDGGTQGVPFAPVGNFSITFVPTGSNFITYAMVFNVPGFGFFFLGSDGNDNGLTTVDNGDGSFTVTGNFSFESFPAGTTFVGIYQNNFDGRGSFTNTIIDARVDGVQASPNMHTGRKAKNNFVADCNGFTFILK